MVQHAGFVEWLLADSGGLFQFEVKPFGLPNALATFQRLIDLTLAGLQWFQYLVYNGLHHSFGEDISETPRKPPQCLSLTYGAGRKLDHVSVPSFATLPSIWVTLFQGSCC